MDLPPNPQSPEEPSPRFQPYQIVCLDHPHARLYAEVVQVVTLKQACWVRPLALLRRSPNRFTPFEAFEHSRNDDSLTLHDLRQGADLVWPTVLFREALDTEVMPLLSELYAITPALAEKSDKAVTAHQQLNQFVREIWQAHTDVFTPQSPNPTD
jgi:hypothetical protein